MHASLSRPRPLHLRHLAAAVAVGCAFVGGLGSASAQDVDPRQAIRPGLAPNVPEAVSRPADWPKATKPSDSAAASAAEGKAPAATDLFRDAVDKDRHVLSSIRTTPGAPLKLPAAATAPAAPAADAGVIQTAFEQAASEQTPSGGVAPPAPQAVSLETALVVARVGPEVVLESDLLTPKALDWLDSVSANLKPEQLRQLKLQICKQVIDQHIETLLVYVDACREIPEDKLPEIRTNVDKAFDEQFLPKLMQEAKAANTIEYEQSLRAKGQSLDRMRKMFFERGIAQEWMRKNAGADGEIPHADMIAWYQNHLAEYDYPAKARFEALTVKDGLKRSRQQAWQMLAEMGNEVLAGRLLADVAKAKSEGPTAASGGQFDWTTKGSLSSPVLDEAIFSLPVGQLSTILADENALHIVRVTERKEAGRTSFVEAQVDIRNKLHDERRQRQVDDYLARLRERTPVWTIFDGEPADAAMTAARPTADNTTRR
jgi:hypothetical protein